MKYYNLHIDFPPSKKTYKEITTILGKSPTISKTKNLNDTEDPSDWWLQFEEDEENDNYGDFINTFMDLLEPKLNDLKKIGVKKEDILIWLVYEYKHQCALGFSPKELKRLGENGIAFNIDCHNMVK